MLLLQFLTVGLARGWRSLVTLGARRAKKTHADVTFGRLAQEVKVLCGRKRNPPGARRVQA
jgi:hypothetical protein